MRFSQLLFPFFNDLLEFVVAVAVIAWLAEAWKRNPKAAIAGWIVGNRLLWLPITFAVLPPVLSILIVTPLFRLSAATPFHSMWILTMYVLPMLSSVLLGMAAASCAPPVDAGGRTRLGAPVAIGAALIFLPLLLMWLGSFQPTFALVQRIFLAAIIITVARLLLGNREAPAATAVTEPPAAQKTPTIALLIGFAPSALALALLPLGAALNLPRAETNALLWMLCAVSVVCCFAASGMLFARRTGAAVVGGILFLLLNGSIAFFFGCCASINI